MFRAILKVLRFSTYLPLLIAFVALIVVVVLLGSGRFQTLMKNTFAKLPGIKNFVTVHYDTDLFVTDVKDTVKLKSSFLAIDYLASIQDAEGNVFLAIYPLIVEAGFDLDKVKRLLEDTGPQKKISLLFPAPEILNVDFEDSPLSIRNSLKGDVEYDIQPLKMAFEKQARSYAMSKGNLLEKANVNARKYFNDLLSGSYDVQMTPQEVFGLTAHSSEKLPIQFMLLNDFEYVWHPYTDFSPADGIFKDSAGREISTGYLTDFRGDINELRERAIIKYPSKKILKFVDPIDPDNMMVCANGPDETVCFKNFQGHLFYTAQTYSNRDDAKQHLKDNLYVAANMLRSESDASQGYLSYINEVRDGTLELSKGMFSSLLSHAAKIEKLSPGDTIAQSFKNLSNIKTTSTFEKEETTEPFNLLYAGYTAVNQNGFDILDENLRGRLLDILQDTPGMPSIFQLYLLNHSDSLSLGEQEISSYIQNIVEHAQISPDFLKLSSPKIASEVFRRKMENLTKLTTVTETLFCGIENGTPLTGENCRGKVIYYDQKSLKTIYAEGAGTINNFLANERNLAPDEFFAVVLSRKNLINFLIADYDLFVFKNDGIQRFRELEDEKDMQPYTYAEINPGTAELNINGDVYRNSVFLEFMQSIYKGRENPKNDLLAGLQGLLTSEVIKKINLPVL